MDLSWRALENYEKVFFFKFRIRFRIIGRNPHKKNYSNE